MKSHSTLKLRASTLAIAAGFALSGLPLAAEAAGLGKVTVFSALGQPLRAEVELSATREELSSMKANLASADAFKAAGLDYASPLQTIRFAIDKRANGQPIIKLTSDKPINEPFVDMLLELNWASGRLVREYTFLLDPPEVAAKAAATVAAPEARPLPAPVAPPATRKAPAEAPMAKPAAPPKAAEAPAERPADGGESYQVKSGDTLRKIASANQHDGVSLDQMLVGLFRANKEAFDGGNMNRLKAGRILTVPDKSAVESVSETEARKVVAVQASDWNAYRRKLAAAAAQAPAGDDAGKQEAAGKITARVEEKVAPAAESKDQVRVSRAEVGKGKPGAKPGEDELLAKEKALKEANDRLASLEKNVNELQKLVELKNQSLAELQKQSAQPAPAPMKQAEPAKPVEAAKPAEPPKPVEAPKVEEKKPEAAAIPAPAEPPKAEEKKPEEAKPVEAPKVEEKKPEPAPKPKVVVPPPPEEEPSFFDELLDNPMLLAGGGGVIALLLGYVAYKRRRASADAAETPLATSTAGLSQVSLSENSVFRNTTGGQSVDTSHTPPQTDFSQAGPGTIDTDEVDPVAEADVYMAYGRDAQAEEILLEAKNKDPKRYAIHLKLLEIYANRQSLKQFESLATELYSDTGGVGADWEKAAAMGLKLDAQNPLYGANRGAAPAPAFDSDATVIVSAQTMKSTVALPGELSQMAAAAAPAAVAAAEEPALNAEPISLDFDLGPATTAAPAKPPAPKSDLESTVTLPEALSTLEEGGAGLDFDLGGGAAPAAASAPVESAGALDFEMPEIKIEAEPLPAVEASALDFDLGFETAAEPAPVTAPAAAPAAVAAAPEPDLVLDAGDAGGLEFDVKLTESTVLGEPIATPSFDMTSINLDLAEPKAAAEPLPSFESGQMETVVNPELANSTIGQMEMPPIGASEEVATKLDLAKAYEEMGDMEGARELLQEVVQEGSAEQQEAARAILVRIGA
ncbi:MAG: pilus assembly protein [Rhodocyclales bacterium]|nr:pilus assembly protein [Rhodocyclales bacterium]